MFAHVAHRTPVSRPAKPNADDPVPLESLVEGWVADRLITRQQAAMIMARDVIVQRAAAAQKGPHQRSSLVTEALGYLGGVIILVASILIASLYWDQVGTTARLVIVGGVAAVLLAAGFAVPARIGEVGERLRSILWLASTGALAGFLGLLGGDALDLAGKHVFLLVSAGIAAYAAGLWLVGRTLLQQLVTMIGVFLTAAALTNELDVGDALPGFAAWGAALIWSLLGWGGVLEPRRFVMVFGAAGMFAGALTTIPATGGIVLALATSVAVIATSVLFRDLLLLAVGALGTLLVLPSSVIELFPGDLAAPIVMLVVGALLVSAGLFIARRRHTAPETATPGHDFSVGTPAAAIAASGVAGAIVAIVIVTMAAI